MNREDAQGCAYDISSTAWADGVDVSALAFSTRKGWMVSVVVSCDGTGVTRKITVGRTIDASLSSYIARIADEVRMMDPADQADATWLRQTLRLIDTVDGASAESRTFAGRMMRGLEMSDVPLPEVRAVNRGVVLQWHVRVRELELSFEGHGFYTVSCWAPKCHPHPAVAWVESYGGAEARKLAFSPVRNAVTWVLWRPPIAAEKRRAA